MPIVLLVFEHLLTIAGFLLAVALLDRVLREHRRPGVALAWVLAIVLIPYVGVPLYLIIGGRKLGRRVQMKGTLYGQGPGAGVLMETCCDAEQILVSAGMPLKRGGNQVTLHFNGESAFASLMGLIEGAQSYIHATTFILGRDETGRAIVDALARKAASGVEVRFLLDSLGCMRSNGRFVRPLLQAGGQVGHFLPVLPLRRKWSANLRNHRKMVIVDGTQAMVGGMNLSTTFMGPSPRPDRFLDSAVFLRGPAVADIEDVFASDWSYATDTAPPEERGPIAHAESPGEACLQVVPSGPDVPEDTLHDALLTACMGARDRIWLATPYFVPDEPMLKALTLQARAGRDVSIVVPARSNHRIADLARGPALRELLEAGGSVYAYEQRVVHAKVLVFDRRTAITGSPNLDMRSMYVNFEIALFHYSSQEIDEISTWLEALMQASRPMTTEPPGMFREWAEGVCLMASPLL